jgi:hypothetical protein
VLYRSIILPPDGEAIILAKTIVARPHLAAKVEEIELEEDEECRSRRMRKEKNQVAIQNQTWPSRNTG